MGESKREYLVYKITCILDNKIYIGCHSTLNKNDRYMGSGIEIKEALKKFGRKCFVKEILFVFETKEEMLAKEKELVTKEFCMRQDTMNRIEGGGLYSNENMVTVKDKEGNITKVYCDDHRYLSGELIHNLKGIQSWNNGFVYVKDKDDNKFWVPISDERYISGELINNQKGRLQVGLQSWKNRKHSEDTKEKMSKKAKERTGEKNSSFGTIWITNGVENKKIKKELFDEYLKKGYYKGRIKNAPFV